MADTSDSALRLGFGTKLSAIVGLMVAFGWPLLVSFLGLSTHELTDVHGDIVNIWTKWLVAFVLCFIAFLIQRRSPSEFGIRWLGWRDSLLALAAVILALALSGVAIRLVAVPASLSNLTKIATVPLSLRVAVLLSAAICEEFIYRGFAIEELAYLMRNRWLAGLLSLAFFTAAHFRLYGLSAALIIPALVGAVFTALYLWRHNLPCCMLVHAIMDGIFLLVMPAIVQPK